MESVGRANRTDTAAAMPAAGAPRPTAKPYSPQHFGRAFGRRKAGRNRRPEWTRELPDEQKELRSDGWHLCGEPELPANSVAPGMSVAEFCQVQGVFTPPKGWRGYDERQGQTWLRYVARELWFRQFCEVRPDLPRSAPQTYAAYAEHDADWLARERLTATKTRVCKARQVLCERREIPKRGKPKGSGCKEWHPRVEELFDKLYRNQDRRVRRTCSRRSGPLRTRKVSRRRL